jgi:polyphosphate kinase 2
MKNDHLKQNKLKRKKYEEKLYELQVELCKLQAWVVHKGLKVIIVFEGRDGAGKGGTIKALTEKVSPRIFRTVALPAPTEREKSQVYIQRYINHFPAAGEVVIFDRSWYNRAGVEYVMGFCTDHEHQRFLELCPEFENYFIESGIILLKYWLEVSNGEQERRFISRITDKTKQWKLSPIDLPARSEWYKYSKARDIMFEATDTDISPWNIVRSDDKKRARLNCIKHILQQIPYKELPQKKIKLPKVSEKNKYDDTESISNRRFIPEIY